MRVLWASSGTEAGWNAGKLLPHILAPAETQLTVLAVLPTDPLPWFGGRLKADDALDRAKLDLLGSAIASQLGVIDLPSDHIRVRVEVGEPARAIAAAAAEERADLIVLGPHRDPLFRGIVGSTAKNVIQHGDWPVLIAAAPRPWQSVLFATDGSESARRAEEFLGSLALGGATVYVVTAGASPSLLGQLRDEDTQGLRHEPAIAIATEATERLRQRGISAGEPYGRSGHAPFVIAERRRQIEADVIVTGAHGHTGWRRALVGSVTSEVAQVSECSLLIVTAPP